MTCSPNRSRGEPSSSPASHSAMPHYGPACVVSSILPLWAEAATPPGRDHRGAGSSPSYRRNESRNHSCLPTGDRNPIATMSDQESKRIDEHPYCALPLRCTERAPLSLCAPPSLYAPPAPRCRDTFDGHSCRRTGVPVAWTNATEFSFVTTSGNASSNTLGLKSTIEGTSDISAFKLEVGGIRAESNFTDLSAVADGGGDFNIFETTRTERSAENYFARSRLDRDLGESNFFAFGGAGWERNTFAGFNNRFSFVAGVGDTWVDD